MSVILATTPGIVEILYATYYFICGKYSQERVEEIIEEVKKIRNKDTLTLIASLKHEFSSELMKELFFYYYRALSVQNAFLNLQDIQSNGVEYDVQYLEFLIQPQSQGY